jgi:hypothetical protein
MDIIFVFLKDPESYRSYRHSSLVFVLWNHGDFILLYEVIFHYSILKS